MNRILLVSPTYESNKEIFKNLNMTEEDVLEPTKDCIQKLHAIFDAEKAEYDAYVIQKKRYKEFQQFMRSNTPIDAIPPLTLMHAMEGSWFDGPPKYKYGQIDHPPRLFVLFDDCLSSDCFRYNSGVVNLAIRHRHVMDGVGVSLAFLMQSYSTVSGLHRCLRENATLLLLWKNRQESQMKLIMDETLSNQDVTEDHFLEMCEYCWREPHGFLCVEFSAKDPAKMYRRNFEEYLSVK